MEMSLGLRNSSNGDASKTGAQDKTRGEQGEAAVDRNRILSEPGIEPSLSIPVLSRKPLAKH